MHQVESKIYVGDCFVPFQMCTTNDFVQKSDILIAQENKYQEK